MLREVESMSAKKPQSTRIESDSMGEIEVTADCYWGTQTQRALTHFNIGDDLIPKEIIKTLAMIEKAAAITNSDLGRLLEDKASLIIQV